MTNNKFKKAVGIFMVLLLSGCSTSGFKSAQRDAKAVTQTTEDMFSSVKKSAPPIVIESSRAWLNKKSIDHKEGPESRPKVFGEKIEILFKSRASILNISDIITRQTGVKIIYAPEINADVLVPFLQNDFRHNDTLASLLDKLTSRTSMSWRYSGNQVEMYKFDTRVFHLAALPGTTEFKAGIGTKSQSSASSGSATVGASSNSGHELKIENKVKFWESIEAQIKQMLTPDGKMSFSESTSSVTVTDTQVALSKVDAYIKGINENKQKQVFVMVEVYSVDSAESDRSGVNWGVVYNNISKNYKVSFANGEQSSNGISGLSSMLIDPSISPVDGLTVQGAVLDALSTQGSSSLVTSVSATTVSGEPVPVHVTKEVTYLASSTTTATSNGTMTTLNPGSITTGFSMNIFPKVMGSDSIFMQAAIDISSLDAMKSITSNSSTIQMPERSIRSVLQKLYIKPGQTLVLGGFQRVEDGFSEGSIGDLPVGAGGNRASSKKRTTLVIMITPQLISHKIQ